MDLKSKKQSVEPIGQVQRSVECIERKYSLVKESADFIEKRQGLQKTGRTE